MRNLAMASIALALALSGAAAADDDAMEGAVEEHPFDTGALAQQGSAEWVADRVGTFVYHCHFHPSMTGTVVVKEGDGAGQTFAVAIRGFAYVPESVTVPMGARVVWTNEDGASHTATAEPHEAMMEDEPHTMDDGAMDNGTMDNGTMDNGTMMDDGSMQNGSMMDNGRTMDDGMMDNGSAMQGEHGGPARTPAAGAVAAIALLAGAAALRRRRG